MPFVVAPEIDVTVTEESLPYEYLIKRVIFWFVSTLFCEVTVSIKLDYLFLVQCSLLVQDLVSLPLVLTFNGSTDLNLFSLLQLIALFQCYFFFGRSNFNVIILMDTPGFVVMIIFKFDYVL